MRPLRPLRGLSLDQMVIVADAVCERTDARIRSYPALAACAAVTHSRLHGVPLHRNVIHITKTLREHVRALRPLTHHNDVFSHVTSDILYDLNT